MLQNLRNKIGLFGENYATTFLKRQGYKILEHNFRSRFGEIDLIAIKDQVLTFVEVKTRQTNRFGFPEEAVSKSKLQKIEKTAEFYVSTHSSLPQKMNIVVLAIENNGENVKSARIIDVF